MSKNMSENESENQTWKELLVEKLFKKENAWIVVLLVSTNGGQALLQSVTDRIPDIYAESNMSQEQVEALSSCPNTMVELIKEHSRQVSEILDSCRD